MEFAQVFSYLDVNGDQTLALEELQGVTESLRNSQFWTSDSSLDLPDAKAIRGAFDSVDTDEDGVISLDEFQAMYQQGDEGGAKVLFNLLKTLEPVIVAEKEHRQQQNQQDAQIESCQVTLEPKAKKGLKDHKKKFIEKFAQDFAEVFSIEAARIQLDKDDIDRKRTTIKFKILPCSMPLAKSSAEIKAVFKAELKDVSKELRLGGYAVLKENAVLLAPAPAEVPVAPAPRFTKKRKPASADAFVSDGLAELYAACAQGNVGAIASFVKRTRSMLPIGALNAAIYHLEMEAVNYLVSSGFVDPNQVAPVPVKRVQNPVSKDQKDCLFPTDEDSIFLYGPVPKHRALHAAELSHPRMPFDLVQYMLSHLPNTDVAKPAKTALQFMKKWLQPTEFEVNEEGVPVVEVNKPWMDMKTVQQVFSKKHNKGMFDTTRAVQHEYEQELHKLWDSLYPYKVSRDDPESDDELDAPVEEEPEERIQVGVFIELMENLGHEYVMEELQAMVPNLNVATEGIEFDFFKFIVTSMYMRVLNQFCDVKDALNIDLQDYNMNMNTGQFTATVVQDQEEDVKIARVMQVLLELGIPTTNEHAIREVREVVQNSENKLTEIRYYNSKTNEPCEKLLFGDFCVLATKLINWQRGNGCTQCLQHTAYKFNECFRNGFFITAHILLLILFIAGAILFLILAWDKVNKDPPVDAGFQRLIDNWQIKPIVDMKYYQAGDNVFGHGICDAGWEPSPTMTWPGSASGPCVCPQFALPYTSSQGECTSSQTSAGCATQVGTTAATVSGLPGTLCFLRAGASAASWDNITHAYTERPMLSNSTTSCPSTHTQCAGGVYSDNSMCQMSGIDCPVRRMVMVTGLFNWSRHYSATYPYVLQIGQQSTLSSERKYLAYDQPVSNETAYARAAAELDVSLNTHCSDGTSEQYSSTQGYINENGTAVNNYATATANCTPSTEWFELDASSETSALSNAIKQSDQCSSQTTTLTSRRQGRSLQSIPAKDMEEEAPPDWWTDVVECPTDETSVKDIDIDAIGKKSTYSQWITDVDGTKCFVSPSVLENADPPDTSGLPPHRRPSRKARLGDVADVQPIARLGDEMYTPPSFARKLLTDTCQTDVACVAKIDLVFVMDSSGSIGSTNYGTMLDFAELTVAQLTIGPNNVQVGFLVYSLTPEYTYRRRRRVMRRRNYDYGYSNYHTYWQFKLGDYTSQVDMSNAIGSSRYLSATTFTGEAIRLAYQELFDTSAASGSRDSSSGVAKIMVVLTDGYATDFSQWNDPTSTSYCGTDGTNYAIVAKTAGASIFALGVSGYDTAQIQGIASKPVSTYARTEGSFSTLLATAFVSDLTTGACNTAATTGDDVPVSTECCALSAWTYYQFTAPAFSTRTITVIITAGSVAAGFNANSNVAGVSAGDTNLVQPTTYTNFPDNGGTTYTWTPSCTAGDLCVMWAAIQCTSASTNFTITQSQDVTPPTITTYNPTLNQVPVIEQLPSIQMTFSEAVEESATASSSCMWTVTATSATTGGTSNRIVGSNVNNVAYTTTTAGTSITTKITLTLTTPLTLGTEYEVQIGSGCVADTSGNNFAGLASGDYKFTIHDETAPYVTVYNPVQSALGVLPDSNVVLTFNVPVQTIDNSFVVTMTPADNNLTPLKCYPNNEADTGCSSSVSGNVLTLNPGTDFYSTVKMLYTVTVDCQTMGNLYCSAAKCGYPITTPSPPALATNNGASIVAEYNCAGANANSPIQVMSNGNSGGFGQFQTSRLEVGTGIYDEVWNIGGDVNLVSWGTNSDKGFMGLNAVSINPKDSKAYGTVRLTNTAGVPGSNDFLIRFDGNTVEYVAHLPMRSYSGTFDREFGYFFLISNSGTRKVYGFKDVNTLAGITGDIQTVADYSLSTNFKDYELSSASGQQFADCVPYKGSIPSTDPVKYWLIGGGRLSTIVLIEWSGDGTALPVFSSDRLLTVVMDTGGGWPNTAKGAGWNYQDASGVDHIYFASNSGAGVYEVDMASIDLTALTVTASRIGSSAASNSNDGMNCFWAALPCGWDGTGLMAAIVSPTYQFSTKDDSAPWIVTYLPSNGGECVSSGTGMVLTFNEAITAIANRVVTLYSYTIAGDYVTYDETDGTNGARHVTLTTSMAPGGGTTLTFSNADLGGTLKAGNRYYVDFPADAVRDDGQNALFNGLSGATGQYAFDVCGVTPPVITTYEPANGAVDQPQDLSFTFTFYDASTMTMVAGTEIQLWKSTGNNAYTHIDTINLLSTQHATMFETASTDSCPPQAGYVGTLNPTSCLITPVSAEITFKFDDLLDSSSTYSIVMNGVMQDTDSTPFAGLSVGTYVINTGNYIAPYITVYNPYNGESNIMSESLTQIVLTFNENVQAGTCSNPATCLQVTKTEQRVRMSTTSDNNFATCNPADPGPSAVDSSAPTQPWYTGMTMTSTSGTIGLSAHITGYPGQLNGVLDYCSFNVDSVENGLVIGQNFAGNLKTITVTGLTGTPVAGDIIRGLTSGARATVKLVPTASLSTPDVLCANEQADCTDFLIAETVYFEMSGAYATISNFGASLNNPTGMLMTFEKPNDGNGNYNALTGGEYAYQFDKVEFTRDTTDSSQVAFSGNTMTIQVPSTLSSQTSYSVWLTEGAVKDLATTPNNNGGLAWNYTFMTSAIVPPPTASPTLLPSWAPTVQVPTPAPSSYRPTTAPSEYPSKSPTTPGPTGSPSWAPTKAPSASPTKAPITLPPTNAGQGFQTGVPTTHSPTDTPSWAPSPAPTTVGPSNAPTEYPSSTPTSVGPTPAPDDCQTDDTLCSDSARTQCDTAQAFADNVESTFYLSYSREAKWTPECSAGDKNSVYKRRSSDAREDGDWQEEMFAVHIPMFVVLLIAGIILDIYSYYKIDGVLCFPPWAIHAIRIVAIILSALLLFYAVLMFAKVYDEYKYYDNVISDLCTDTEYEPPFNAMRDSLQDMYERDAIVVVFDFLVLVWFCLLFCCMNVKIFRRFDATKWSCWQAKLPEYMSAGNGVSEGCFYWDGQLPEEDGCPCGDTYCGACGCNCLLCTSSPQGARIDIDVLGARRRMYYRLNDPDEDNRSSDEQAIGVSPADDTDTSQLSKSGNSSVGSGSGMPVVPSRNAGRKLIQGAPPIIIPHTLLPKPEEKDPKIDEIEEPLEADPWNGDHTIEGFSHATVAMSAAETWQIADNNIVDQSAKADTFAASQTLDELKDQLTNDSRKALDDAMDAAKRGEVSSDLVLAFKDPTEVGSKKSGPKGGKSKQGRRRGNPKQLMDENPEMPLSEMFNLLDPESMAIMENRIRDFAKNGDLDEALGKLTNIDRDQIDSSGNYAPRSDSDLGQKVPKPTGGRSRPRNKRQADTVMKWVGDDALQPLGSDPSVGDFDEHLRNLLKDADLNLKFADPEKGDVDFNNMDMPLSEMFKLLDPESMDALQNAIRDLANSGGLDEPLSKLTGEMHNKINESEGGLITIAADEESPDAKHNTVMQWVGDDKLQQLMQQPGFADFDGCLRDLIRGSDMTLSMAADPEEDQSVSDRPLPKRRKGKNPLGDSEMPLSEMYQLLDPDSMAALENAINNLAERGDLDDLLDGLPSSIRKEIDELPGNKAKKGAGGRAKPKRNQKARDTVMNWLDDPDGQLTSLLDNPAVFAFDGKLRNLLTDMDLDLAMADVLGTVIKLQDCDLQDFAASLSDLTAESKENVLNAIAERLAEIPMEEWPLIEDLRFSGGGRKRSSRQVTVNDVMDLLNGGDSMSDEFKCEIERFMKEQGILNESYFKTLAVDFAGDNKMVTLKVGITPMMKFDPSSSAPALLADNFMIDAAQDMIFQLHAAESQRGDKYVDYNIIDANAASVTALEFTNMNSVVSKPFSDFFTGDEMGEMLHDSILAALVQAKHSSMDEMQAVQLYLDMTTKSGLTVRGLATITVDLRQYVIDPMTGLKKFLPIITMKLVKRSYWELVKNGPMMITSRPAAAGNSWGPNDRVNFTNQKAKTLIADKHLPTELFPKSGPNTDDRGGCLGSVLSAPNTKTADELERQFAEFYSGLGEAVSVDLLMGGARQHCVLSPLTDPDMARLTLAAKPLYGVLCDCSDSVIFATDMKGRVIDMNDEATAKLTGDAFAGSNIAMDHMGRHYTRYIDPLDRKHVVEKAKACLESGKAKTFDKMIVMTSSDFQFDLGAATYDLLLSLQVYPHFDKHGKVAGLMFEGKEVSLMKLEADAARHIFSHCDDDQKPEPLQYCDDDVNYLYDLPEDKLLDDLDEYGCMGLRKVHAPMIGLSMDGTVEQVTHAALLEFQLEFNDIMQLPFEDFLQTRSLNDFHTLCEYVKADPTQPQIGDMFFKGEEMPKKITVSPWYNERAEMCGLLINMNGLVAAFEMDSDGYVLDCTPEAARILGYTRNDIIGKALIKHVDGDSCVDALDTLSDLLFMEDIDEFQEYTHNKIVRINMLRQTKRVIQTTWDAVRMNQDKDTAIVVMHKEKLTNKIRRANANDADMDAEEKGLRRMKPMSAQEKAKGEKVELTATERAQLHTEPVKYHFAVMQPFGNIEESCSINDFRKYLAEVWQEQRPWELHRLNVYFRPKVKAFFERITKGKDAMTFEDWEAWWDKSENRTTWDGGLTMEHVVPPGRQDPYDFDRK